MSDITVITEDEVKTFLTWESLVASIEESLSSYSKKDGSVVQPARMFVNIIKGVMYLMPGYLRDKSQLGCKLVTSFPENKELGLPSIMGNIMLFDDTTGKMKALVAGTEITGWRTAAASIVATKHLHKGEKNILAILGAGTQGKFHALGMQHLFNFKEVRIWNRTYTKAQSLCESLERILDLPNTFKPYRCNEDCVRGANVIVTATYSNIPIVKHEWLEENVHINAVGAGLVHYSELDKLTYENSVVVTDSMESARKELDGLFENNINIIGEIGQVINGSIRVPDGENLTIFHSLGMAVEDVAAANLVYNEYIKTKSVNQQ